MEREYAYSPEDKPVVGGYAAIVPPGLRERFRHKAIEACQRVTNAEAYQQTGDVAFDLRAAAFREVLKAGTKQAFEESHESFLAMGL